MKARSAYPVVDGRRLSDLRSDLLRDIAALAPDWQAPAEPQGADRAIVEIGARLAEEATRRLDLTPERDALAFLQLFDVAPPRPSAAVGVSVFVLKDTKTDPVIAPARTRLEIASIDGEDIAFETADDLRIHPARISVLASVDPSADRLELAPADVFSLEPDLIPRPDYQLATSAGPEARAIALVPPVGILSGDLLKVSLRQGGTKFLRVVAFSEDGLAELDAQVGGAGLASADVLRIERMTRLETFRMPDAQEHGFYIGDPDLLNVKEPAEIRLRLEPAQAGALLTLDLVDFELWGTREGPGTPEEEPRWHRLVVAGGSGRVLRLLKTWTGAVEEHPLGDKTARYIRIRPRAPIVPTGGAHPLTGEAAAVDRITLGIKTEAPDGDSSDTISQVAYNGTPLPLASAFLPFGAEPRRFDTFALAAPEAFTKPDARVWLDFSLTDATMNVLAAAGRLDEQRHAYGVGRNGRLQAIMLTGERTLWREIGVVPEEAAEGEALLLDTAVAPAAFGQTVVAANASEADDIVVAATASGRLATARIKLLLNPQASADEAIQAQAWNLLPALPEGTVRDGDRLSVAVAPVLFFGSYRGLVLAAADGGVNALVLSYGGAVSANADWLRVPADPNDAAPELSSKPYLLLADGSPQAGPAVFVTTDAAQALWVLSISLDGSVSSWTRLVDANGDPVVLEPGARPAAILDPGGANRLLIAVPRGGALDLWEFDADIPFGYQAGPVSRAIADLSAGAFLRFAPRLQANEVRPHVLSYQDAPGAGQVIEWAPDTDEVAGHTPAPDMVLDERPDSTSAAIFPPSGSDPQARLAFAAGDQRIVSVKINPSALADALDDHVVAPPGSGLPDVLVVHDFDPAMPNSGSIATGATRGTDAGGGAVFAFGSGNVDWNAELRVYRADDPEVVKYVGANPVNGALTGDSGSAAALAVGQPIIVRPNAISPDYRLLTVASTNGDDELTVNEPDELDDLLGNLAVGDTVNAVWYSVEEVAQIAAATEPPNRQTLVRLDGPAPGQVSAVGFFAAPGTADLTPLSGTGAVTRVIVPPWPDPPPPLPAPNSVLFKLVPQNATPEALVANSLSAKFSDPELSWEYFDGDGWKRLDKGFRDKTAELQRSGEVSFVVPRDLSQSEIGGQEDYWIRARLVAGDYGSPEYKVETSGNVQTVKVDTSKLRPPEVARVTARFDLDVGQAPQFVIARNNMRDLDQSSANGLAGAAYAMFEGAFARPIGDRGRALFLGLSSPIEPGSASLFVETREKPGTAKLVLETLGPENSWAPAPLSDEDPTRGLHRTGLIRFNVTERPAQVFLFGQSLHWLRIRAEAAGAWAPDILGIWLNGVRIEQAETIRQELLGSSAGQPDLELSLLKPPVLANSLELRVRERLSSEEVDALRDGQEPGEPKPVLDAVANLPGQWVLWRQVDSLHDQPADARVYLMNPDGSLRFGDDRTGRIVPAGQDNIRAFQYQSGGRRVETGRFADSKLSGTVEGVETVLAPAQIAGGRLPATAPELVARMPAFLRHAGRGLSLFDLEALARDEDSEIVQVRAFAPVSPGAPIRLVVLARGDSRTPAYSLAQQENLQRVLTARMSDAWPEDCLEVQSARFVQVKVTARLRARPGGLATLETQAGDRLGTFLHAALGGPETAGWPPGRALWPTDIRRALADVAVLDRVVDVQIEMPDGRVLGDVGPEEVITTARVRDVTILLDGEAET